MAHGAHGPMGTHWAWGLLRTMETHGAHGDPWGPWSARAYVRSCVCVGNGFSWKNLSERKWSYEKAGRFTKCDPAKHLDVGGTDFDDRLREHNFHQTRFLGSGPFGSVILRSRELGVS